MDRTGARLALTDGRTSGTVLVWYAIALTPTMIAPSVQATCFSCEITFKSERPTMATTTATSTSVTHATKGTAASSSSFEPSGLLARLPTRQQMPDSFHVTSRTDGHFLHRAVRLSQQVW